MIMQRRRSGHPGLLPAYGGIHGTEARSMLIQTTRWAGVSALIAVFLLAAGG